MDKRYRSKLLWGLIFGLAFFQARAGYAQDPIIITENPIVGETCQNDGSVSFGVSNNVETDFYRVVLSDGTVILNWTEIDGNTITVDGLGSGEYILEIYDAYRDMADPFQHDFVIVDERQIIITPIVKNVQCFGDDPVGSIRFEVKTIGCGSNNIRVSYKHQEDAIFTPEATIGLGGGKSEYIDYLDGTINFPIGVYDFKVRQGGGNCTDCGILDYKVTVGGPPSALEIDEYDIAVQDVTCSGTTYYQATANPTGGWGGYTYLWSDGQTTQTATYLSPGNTYTVTVTDAGGCVVEATKTMPGNNSITMTITAELTDPVCGAYTDIDFNDYTVTWMKDDPDTGTAVSGTQNGIENLPPATYFLILTDKNNSDCKIIREYALMEQGTPVSVDPSDQEICERESVVFTPSIAAPTGNYTFHWYHDIYKIDPLIDNADLGPQEVVYDLDASGVLTITGLSFDGTDNTYSYFVDVSGDGVCETPAGELKEVTVAVNPTPGPPNVSVLGGHSRNF
jgi:hypothetical protein